MSNAYSAAKNVFAGLGDSPYVGLDKSALAYQKIVSAFSKPARLVLFYGEPGCGKTFLLQKIYADLKDKQKIVFFPRPFFAEGEMASALFHELWGETKDNIKFEEIIAKCKERSNLKSNLSDANNSNLDNQIILLLDEAQLYPAPLVEKIRFLADSGLFKILFTIHKTASEDALAKAHFQTRIWENIELRNSTFAEVALYVQKELDLHGFGERFRIFDKTALRALHRFSGGNLRELNKLLYRFFELAEYYEEHRPTMLTSSKGVKQTLEMAALAGEMINA